RLATTAVLALGFDPALGGSRVDTIQDNSFLVEEAYNQEEGVCQHISSYTRVPESDEWVFSFTQEWPVGGPKHQLSWPGVAAQVGRDDGGERGVGDFALNYRFQAIGGVDATIAFAPRVSLLFPLGDARRGLGAGGPGLQLNLPASFVLGSRA